MKLKNYTYVTICFLLLGLGSAGGQSSLSVDLRLYDIVYHPGLDKLFGAFGGDRPGGHAILQIHPRTGQVESRVPVASEPHVLRFSANYKYLYVGYLGSERLDRIEMASRQVETVARLDFNVEHFEETNVFYYQVDEMLPLPDFPDGILVGTRDNFVRPETRGLFVFDGQQVLPEQIDFSSHTSRSLAYHTSSGKIYGYGHDYRHKGGLLRYRVDASGVQLEAEFDLLNGFRSEIEIIGDRLYSQQGEVLDLSGATPVRLGDIYDDENRRFQSGALEVDPQDGLIYNVDIEYPNGPEGPGYYLNKIDPSDFKLLERQLFKSRVALPIKMVHTGGDGQHALLTHSSSNIHPVPLRGRLVLIGNCDQEASGLLPVTTDIDLSSICPSDSIQFAAGGNYDRYVWSNGFEGQQLRTDFRGGTEDLFVTAYDAQGCPQAISETIEIRPRIPRGLQLGRTGELRCPGDSVVLSVTALDTDYFEWSTGERGPSITVREAGVYTVQAYRNSGCTSDEYVGTNVQALIHPPIPRGVLSPSDTIELCKGSLATLTAEETGYAYEWEPVVSFHGRQLDTDWANSYRVRYVDVTGCKGEFSEPVTVIFRDLPEAPELRVQDSMIYTLTLGEKEWFENGFPLPQQTSDTLIASSRGFYAAQVVDSFGCRSDLSAPARMENPYAELASTIAGTAFVDYNQNDVLDSIDFPLDEYWIELQPENRVRFTDEDGYFEYVRPRGNYELQMRVDTSIWAFRQGAGGHQVNSNLVPDSFYTFSIYPIVTAPRLQVDLSTGITRCNLQAPLWVSVKNVGTLPFSGELCVQLDDRLTEVLEDDQPILPFPAEVCWTIDSLAIGEDFKRKLRIGIPGVDNIGDILELRAEVSKDTAVVADWTYFSEIRCAYDPNDKLVSPARGSEGQYALFEDTLRYTIRFQNTGNDTAFTVRLVDQLSDRLRWNTFQPVSASHEYRVDLDLKNGLLEILFENILLPDSTTNLEGSQGYFSFDILPQDELEENTIIENFADIYFDFNPPIRTNTTSSEMVSELPVIDALYELNGDAQEFYFVPNPHRDRTVLYRRTPTGASPRGRIDIYNAWGQQVWSATLPEPFGPVVVETADWPAGLYFYQLRTTEDSSLMGRGAIVKME